MLLSLILLSTNNAGPLQAEKPVSCTLDRLPADLAARVRLFAYVHAGDPPLLTHWLTHYASLGVDLSRANVTLDEQTSSAEGQTVVDASRELLRKHRVPFRTVHGYTSKGKALAANEFMATLPRDALLVYPDLDELFHYPCGLAARLRQLHYRNQTMVLTAAAHDRVAADWTLRPLEATADIAAAFPRACPLSQLIQGHPFRKVVMTPVVDARGGAVRYISSHQLVALQDGKRLPKASWGVPPFDHYRYTSTTVGNLERKIALYRETARMAPQPFIFDRPYPSPSEAVHKYEHEMSLFERRGDVWRIPEVVRMRMQCLLRVNESSSNETAITGSHGSHTSSSSGTYDRPLDPQLLFAAQQDLLVCRAFPAVCTASKIRLKKAIVTASVMRAHLPMRTLLLALTCSVLLGVGYEVRSRSSTQAARNTAGATATPMSELVPKRSDGCGGLAKQLAVAWSEAVPMASADAVISLKLFIYVLLQVELADLMAPEICVLATPELIALERSFPTLNQADKPVPRLVEALMPDLSNATADAWAERLGFARAVLLGAWGAFLLLPAGWSRSWAACYVLGAALYFVLGSVGLMYNLCHSVQGPMLFVLLAAAAVPCLASNPRAAAWLRQVTLAGVLVPVYLFSGVSKIRYNGVLANLTGEWLLREVLQSSSRDVFPSLIAFFKASPLWRALFSWGNLAVEIVIPLLTLFVTNGRPGVAVRLLSTLSDLTFHVCIFLLLGPNFIRLCLVVLFAANPLALRRGGRCGHPPAPPSTPPTIADAARAVLACTVVLSWFAVHLQSHAAHLVGTQPPYMHLNRYWPLPELSMFTYPGKYVSNSNHGLCVVLLLAVLAMLTRRLAKSMARA